MSGSDKFLFEEDFPALPSGLGIGKGGSLSEGSRQKSISKTQATENAQDSKSTGSKNSDSSKASRGSNGSGNGTSNQITESAVPEDDEKERGRQVYGLGGILSVIKRSDPNVNLIALGKDLTTLGLELSQGSNEPLHKTFSSPLSDSPARNIYPPDYQLPKCYTAQKPSLKPGHFPRFDVQTLFYIFYYLTKDQLQLHAAKELCAKGWKYHIDSGFWYIEESDGNRKVIKRFNYNAWEMEEAKNVPQNGFFPVDSSNVRRQ